jgi:hypothetical protein
VSGDLTDADFEEGGWRPVLERALAIENPDYERLNDMFDGLGPSPGETMAILRGNAIATYDKYRSNPRAHFGWFEWAFLEVESRTRHQQASSLGFVRWRRELLGLVSLWVIIAAFGSVLALTGQATSWLAVFVISAAIAGVIAGLTFGQVGHKLWRARRIRQWADACREAAYAIALRSAWK